MHQRTMHQRTMHRRTMHRRITPVATAPTRMASWIRKDYPKSAPQRGHCYLLALCGVDYVTR